MAKSKLEPAQPLEEVWSNHEQTATGQFAKAKDVLRYLLAGKATVTLRSKKTGTRYTYRVNQPKAEGPHFVKVMYGPDNTADYVFLGTIFEGGTYRHGRKSPLQEKDVRELAFCYMWDHVLLDVLPASLEIWHEGMCARCGRKLTVPESIATGIGPECAAKL